MPQPFPRRAMCMLGVDFWDHGLAVQAPALHMHTVSSIAADPFIFALVLECPIHGDKGRCPFE